jgi:hypothetical protein
VLSNVNIGGLAELLRPDEEVLPEISGWQVGFAGYADRAAR